MAIAIAGAAALAEDERPAGDVRGACRTDFEAMCSDIGEDSQRSEILGCLEEHKDELSGGCRAALDAKAAGTPRSSRSSTCRDEIRRLCPDARGPQAMRQCIEEHRDELPEECQKKPSSQMRRGGHGGGYGRRGSW
jgi:hypothetical protein